MLYTPFKNLKISTLGLGCMRFPTLADGETVDKNALEEIVERAISGGINYFDTAWIYHNGKSEILMGEVLKKYPRESYFLADKFPGYDLENMGKVEEIFEKQLEKCGVDYFDFYLFHNVSEGSINEYLDPKYKTFEYLYEQKKNGRIRHLGFSTHGTVDTMKRFLDAYGEHMEFCQIQLNWLDYRLQGAKAKVELLNSYGIPIWVMEPVRGGRLAKLDEKYEAELKELRPEASIPEWAFRFLQSIPGVTLTLSGMSNLEQIDENIRTFSEAKPLSDTEMKTILGIADKMMSEKSALPCTACRYCISHCPMELDIPELIQCYNEFVYSKSGGRASAVIGTMPDGKRPSACIGCRGCEAVCPQNIKISEMMQSFTEKLSVAKD